MPKRLVTLCPILPVVTAGLFLCGAPILPLRAEPQRIEKTMSKEQFRAAGLTKLTPEELEQLNGWLYGYTSQREKLASQQAVATERAAVPKRAVASPDLTETRIDGPFEGLTGGTIIRLQNGQVYQQANYQDNFQTHLDNPEVVIQKNIFGSVMAINGFSRRFYVRKLSGN